MAKQLDQTISVGEVLEKYVSSIRKKPGRNKKLTVNVEVRFQKGRWVATESSQWVERKPIKSEVLEEKLTQSDWGKIFSLPELSRRERLENEINQQVFLWLKAHRKNPEDPNSARQLVQHHFNRWCKRLPYRIVNFRRFQGRGVDRSYVAKLY